jgi:alpha-D-xyloside xylohydrolase
MDDWIWVFMLVVALGLTACGSTSSSPGEDIAEAVDLAVTPEVVLVTDLKQDVEEGVPAMVVIDDGAGFAVTIATQPFGITARRDGELVWDGSDLPLLVGRVPLFDASRRYDPELVSDDVEWLGLETVIAYEFSEGGGHRFTFEPMADRQLTLTVERGGEGIITFELAPGLFRDEVLTAVEYLALDADENFYGLGESFDHVARRGTIRQMHMTIDFLQESGYNEAHYPIPLLISTRGSGIFVEDRHPGFFDVCSSDPGRVIARFSSHSLRFHLLSAPTPLAVLSRYVALTGNPALPPQWAFGVVQWEDEIDGQAQVMENAQAMRDLDLPGSGMWVDRPFATAHESFVFKPDSYPDAQGMVQDLHSLGFRLAIWSAPYLSDGVPEAYAEAEANDYFVESDDINFTKFGRLMDFTDPGAVALWQSLVQRAIDIGIEGFKLDYGEDVISGYSSYKTSFNFFNGEPSETMHHWYQYFYHKAYRELLPEHAFLINRAGCYGDQTITSVVWPGDLCTSFKYHQEDGHVGGLPAAMIGNQTLSVSGYPFYGSDTGGYRHGRPTKEVLLRWVQHTALSPVLQFGGAGANCNPWDFTLYEGEDDGVPYVSQYDEETLAIWRTFSRLHIRLFPYVYTYAVAASQTGIPVTRPFGMVHPEQGHPDFQYFYGDYFTVAPVMREESSREVLIPPGRWFDWFDDVVYEGPAKVTTDVSLDRLVLLVREGAIIPLLRPTIDTLAPATAPGVESYANEPGVLHVHLWPGEGESNFQVVLGPTLSMVPLAEGVRVLFAGVTGAFSGLHFEIHGKHLVGDGGSLDCTSDEEIPLSIVEAEELGSCTGCQFWDAEAAILHVIPEDLDGAIIIVP